MVGIVWDLLKAVAYRLPGASASRADCIHAEKLLREHLTEKQIDKMVADSFPASDPPSSY